MAPPFRRAFVFLTDLLVPRSFHTPRWVRRLIVLTFPVSFLVLFGAVCVTLVLALVEAVVLGVFDWLRDLWSAP